MPAASTVSRIEAGTLSPGQRFAAACDEAFPQMGGWFSLLTTPDLGPAAPVRDPKLIGRAASVFDHLRAEALRHRSRRKD